MRASTAVVRFLLLLPLAGCATRRAPSIVPSPVLVSDSGAAWFGRGATAVRANGFQFDLRRRARVALYRFVEASGVSPQGFRDIDSGSHFVEYSVSGKSDQTTARAWADSAARRLPDPCRSSGRTVVECASGTAPSQQRARLREQARWSPTKQRSREYALVLVTDIDAPLGDLRSHFDVDSIASALPSEVLGADRRWVAYLFRL